MLDEAGRGSHPDLGTLNGARDGLESAGRVRRALGVAGAASLG